MVPYQVAECPLGGLCEHFQDELDEVRVVVVEPQQLHQVRHRRGEEPAEDLERKAVISAVCCGLKHKICVVLPSEAVSVPLLLPS